MTHEDEVEQLHRVCDEISDRALSVEAKVEAIATEARELKHRAEQVKYGNASYDDLVALKGAADEMERVFSGELDRALDALRSTRLG